MPENSPPHPAALVLYWDYELQHGADRCLAGPRSWGLDDHRQTACLLGTLDIYEIPSTFAILGAAAEDGDLPYCSPRQVREIAALGHEIASHSHRHEFLPGLERGELVETLARSKDTLEQVTGRAVVSFVPPHDYPTRYWLRGAPGLHQARKGGGWLARGIPWMCRALREVGYETCRVSYRGLTERLVPRPPIDDPRRIQGVLALRNGGCGFGERSRRLLRQAANRGGTLVVYGHPHSLKTTGDQSLSSLEGFLDLAARLRREGRLEIRTAGETSLALGEPEPVRSGRPLPLRDRSEQLFAAGGGR